jgi:hypothetical protein
MTVVNRSHVIELTNVVHECSVTGKSPGCRHGALCLDSKTMNDRCGGDSVPNAARGVSMRPQLVSTVTGLAHDSGTVEWSVDKIPPRQVS